MRWIQNEGKKEGEATEGCWSGDGIAWLLNGSFEVVKVYWSRRETFRVRGGRTSPLPRTTGSAGPFCVGTVWTSVDLSHLVRGLVKDSGI